MKELVIFTCAPVDEVSVVVEKFFNGVAFERMTCDEKAMWFKFENPIVSLYMLNGLKAALQELDAEIQDPDFQIML